MNCAWKELLDILSPWIRAEVDRTGREVLQELRLRINAPPEMIGVNGYRFLEGIVREGDIRFCINAASKYSPWSVSTTEKGYLTAPGGHRIGLCGQVIITPGNKRHLQEITSVCIRVARDFPGIAEKASHLSGSVLIIGAPGWGKTTLLRDLCRTISEKYTLCVSDERCELFPAGIPRGSRMDVLSGCPKSHGVEMLLRTMSPRFIAVDEITASEDCDAIVMASNCGVCFLATAHAASVEDYLTRTVYRPLIQHRIFQTLVVLRQDKSYTIERMCP